MGKALLVSITSLESDFAVCCHVFWVFFFSKSLEVPDELLPSAAESSSIFTEQTCQKESLFKSFGCKCHDWATEIPLNLQPSCCRFAAPVA